MSKILNINEVNHPHIEKRINYIVVIGSIIGMIAGGLVIYSSNTDATINTGLLSIGVTIIIIGIYFLLVKSKQNLYKETGSKISKKSFFFERSDFDRMIEILNSASFDEKPIKFLGTGSTRLDVISSKDNQFAAAQLLEFVPFQHEPATPVYYFTNDQAKNFIAYIEKCAK